MTEIDVAIAGGGPAGMVAGLLFARAGLRVTVFEKHADFLRDFRGDTVHPSTLGIFADLGLLDRLLSVPHTRLPELRARVFGRTLRLVDLQHLRVPFIALMPQWDFLDFVAAEARRYPNFELRQDCRVDAVIEDGGRIAGLRLADAEAVRARLTIACDGRDSRLRKALDARTVTIGAPMDVLWFRLPKPAGLTEATLGNFDANRLVVTIDRGDYFQCAYVIAKGGADVARARGIDAFRDAIRAIGPETARVDEGVTGWDDVKLLTVAVDRLDRWHRPGLLVIGDAAHAMSPIGGVGINLAIQDAVAAANALAAPMAAGADPDPLLAKVAARRMFPTRATQAFQKAAQDRIVAPLLAGRATGKPPLAALLLDRIPLLRRVPGRLLGLGVRPERVRSPANVTPAARP
ncbi:MAG: FAD-dependent oxidoreductase [Pseudomonadota bacterium]